MAESLATTPPSFFAGVLFGTLLLAVGLGLGFATGLLVARRPGGTRGEVPPEQLSQVLQGISYWNHGIADEMKQYRHEVDQLVSRFRGDDTADLDPADQQLLDQIVQANSHLTDRLDEAEKTLQHQARELSGYVSEARTDTLTQLPNRRSFDDELNRRIAEWDRHKSPVSLLLIDIDHFKSFNDRFGHLAGDAVLRDVAQVLQEAMRNSDMVTRYGGEEFAVILVQSNWRQACQAAERARQAVQSAVFQFDNQLLTVTVSCGAAQALEKERPAELIHRSDQALYAAKENGRNVAYLHNGKRCRSVIKSMNNQLSSSEPQESGGSRPVVSSPAPRDFGEVCDDLRNRLEQMTHQ